MWEWIQIGLVLGPGAYLLGRAQFFDKEPSKNALILILLWTYIMLFVNYTCRRELADDHHKACRQLERLLVQRDADAMEISPDSVKEWEGCYRHSEDYLEAEADYRAEQVTNR